MEEAGVHQMESDGRHVRGDAGVAVQQRQHHEKIEGQRAPIQEVEEPTVGEVVAEERKVAVNQEHAVKWLPPEPVAVELGKAAEEIRHGDLEAEEPECPRRHLVPPKLRIESGIQ